MNHSEHSKKPGRAGIIGTVAGLAAAGIAASFATERYLIKKARKDPDDPYGDEPFGKLPVDDVHTVTTSDGIPIHVEIVNPGNGAGVAEATVVFVHGYCLDMGTFHFQRRAVSESTLPVRCVFYDQPGHGKSGDLPTIEYGIDSLAEALYTVLSRSVPTGPVILVGHSMGGMTIMNFARRFPQLFASRVVGVGLLSTTAGGLDKVSFGAPRALARSRRYFLPVLGRAASLTPGAIDQVRKMAADLAWMLTRRYGFATPKPSPALVSYVESMNTRTPIKTVIAYSRTLLEHDEYEAMSRFESVPTLISCGSKDHFTPAAHAVKLSECIPGSTLDLVPDVGHVALLEHPDKVSDVLLEHIKSILADVPQQRASTVDKARKPWLRKKNRTEQ